MVHQVVLIQNGVYRSDALELDALPHRTHVFAGFAPGQFLFRFREVIATRLTSVRPILTLALQASCSRPVPGLRQIQTRDRVINSV